MKAVKKALEEFMDVIVVELPKMLPPRSEVNHAMEWS